jgi:glycosyltransferase involved in cell wall biosynthesis
LKTFSVIIPTRNRNKLLDELVQALPTRNDYLKEIIIVDSSDETNAKEYTQDKINYIYTEIKSAATQRNIGIQNLNSNSEIVFFLDDDVRVKPLYFEKIIENFSDSDIVGVSGLAVNTKKPEARNIPSGISGNLKRFFLLDSVHDGVLLPSAINIPVRIPTHLEVDKFETNWLIGCSAWRREILSKVKFDDFFTGQSLGEDVLFSTRAKRYGKLVVNKTIIFDHIESPINRPNQYEFYKMWVVNRYKISNELKLSTLNWAFHWSNFGKIASIVLSNHTKKKNSILGFWVGYKEIIWKI